MKGRQTEFADPESMESTNREPKEQCDTDGSPNWETIGQQHRNNNAGKANDSADRQVDAGRDDDKRLANGEDRCHGTLPEQVLNIVRCREALGAKRQHDPHQRQERDKVRLSSVPIRALFFVAVNRTASAICASVLLSALIVGYSPEAFFQGYFRRRQTPIASVRIVSWTAFSPIWLETSLPRRKTCRVSQIS